MIAFLLSAAIVGVAVVFFLPFVKGQIEKSATLSDWMKNPVVQVIVVGAIVALGIAIFAWIARSLKVPVAVR